MKNEILATGFTKKKCRCDFRHTLYISKNNGNNREKNLDCFVYRFYENISFNLFRKNSIEQAALIYGCTGFI
ncbi:MAG: hypothetical protein ABUT20_41300 [Bacteroidota bacterium]